METLSSRDSIFLTWGASTAHSLSNEGTGLEGQAKRKKKTHQANKRRNGAT